MVNGLKVVWNLIKYPLLKNIAGKVSVGFEQPQEQLISFGKGILKASMGVNLEVTVTNWQTS